MMVEEGGAVAGSQQREMVALEAQLRSSVRVQLENIRDSLRCLGGANDRLRESGEALERVTELCQQSEGLIDNYAFIKQVSRTHQNFSLTKRVYDEFRALAAKVERCAELLEADTQSGRPDNLLLVYHYLSKLETFRKQTLELMRDAPSTAVYTIKRYFKTLDDLVNAFEDFYWKLPRQLFTMIEGGQASHIVAILKVLMAMDVAARPRFTAILDDMIAAKFAAAIQAAGVAPASDLSSALEALSFWQEDLLLVRNELVPKFPPAMNILDFFILTYHRNIHAVLAPGLAGKLGPADILFVIGWARTYHEEMAAQLGVSTEDLEPHLLEDREPQLIAEYVALSRGKINEWVGNLMAATIKNFSERPQQPEMDAENHFMTPAGIDLFQIVKQHIDTAAQASRGRLLLEIEGECVRSVNSFLAGMSRTLEVEKGRYLEKPEAAPPYFEDHVIMLGNTCLKWVSYLDDLVEDVEQHLATEFVALGSKTLKSLGEGFVNLAKACTQVLVEIIFRAVQPAIQQIGTAAWYGETEGIMSTILATFEDFFKDYEQHADQFLLNKLVADVLERLLLAYFAQLKAKSCKLKMPAAPGRLEGDVQAVLAFFSSYRDGERVRRALDPLAKFTALVCSSQRMIFLEFVSFWKLYPDLPLSYFEEVISRRDDLDRTAVREIVESCRKKTLEEKIMEATPSIFSKIK